MKIVHGIADSLFGAKDQAALIAEIQKFYSVNGYVPTVTVEGDKVVVEIDAARLGQAEASYRKAVSCCNRGDFAKAEALLRAAVQTCPAYSDAYRLLAQIEMGRGNVDRAIDVNLSALKSDPKNLAALVLMGNLLSRDPAKLDQAAKYYEKVLEIEPGNAIANANVAAIFCKQGKVQEGIARFDKVLAAHPEHLVAHHGKTMAYVDLGDLNAAFEAASRGLKEGVDTPENPGIRKILTKSFEEIAVRVAERADDGDAPAKKLIDEIHELDPRPIKLVSGYCDGMSAMLQQADMHHTDEHLVIYDRKKQNPHVILHELTHLSMMTKADHAGKMKWFAHTNEQYRRFIGGYAVFFKKLEKKYGKAEALKQKLYDWLMLQLMNCPLDLFVEKRIYENAAFRPVQAASLLAMEKGNLKGNREHDLSIFPQDMVSINRTMQIVTSMMLKKLYGVDLISQYQPSKSQLAQAKDLFGEYESIEANYQDGDEYKLLKYFIASFRLGDFVTLAEKLPRQEAEQSGDQYDHLTKKEKADQDQFEKNYGDGKNPMADVVMVQHMVKALKFFDGKAIEEVRTIAYQIAMLGVGGIDPNKQGYEVLAIPGKQFSGFELLAYYYVSWKIAEPDKLGMLQLHFDDCFVKAFEIYHDENE